MDEETKKLDKRVIKFLWGIGRVAFLLLLVVSLGINAFYFLYREPLVKKLIVENNHLKKEQKIYKSYILQDERIKCMVKTLTIAYDISEWEAYFYSKFFDDFSLYFRIPWEIYPALVRVESNFNPTRRSKAGCKGLMQLKESTAKAEAKKLNINFVESQSLWNEFINLPLGVNYLSRHIKKEGNIEGGIKCYLGGPDYLKSVKRNGDISKYVKEYKTRVSKEYEQLKIMYRGVVDELSNFSYEDIYKSFQTDSISLIFSLFATDSTKS